MKLSSATVAFSAIFAAFAAIPYALAALGAEFWVNIIAEILIWSLLAASVNLLFGYVGLLSFGQALFFGFGMYGATLAILHLNAGFWTGLLAGIVAATAIAAISGALAVRLSWHYFAIITVIFSLIFYFAAMSWRGLTGGDDGLSFAAPAVFDFGGLRLTLADPKTQYYTIASIVALCFALFFLIVHSTLGVRFRAVKENERRAALIGINVYRTRLLAFVIAGALAGVSGALFAFFGRYASASYMFYHVSGEAVVWAVVGGLGTVFGPFLGTGVLIVFREAVSGFWEHYLVAVGAMTIIIVMFAPRGIAGFLGDFYTAAKLKMDGGSKEVEIVDSGHALRKRRAIKSTPDSSPQGETILSLRALSKRFGGLRAVDGVDLDVKAGRLNAIIGPNGAGKTTLFNLITGELRPSSGSVHFAGRPVAYLPPHRVAARGISRTLQIKSVFNGLSVADNVLAAVLAHEGIGSAFRTPAAYPSVQERVALLLDTVGLDNASNRMAGTLSYGDIALLEIAIALANEPKLLLLDEPVCGMGPEERQRCASLIRSIARRTNVILIEHDMDLVFAISDHVTVMAEGRILANGIPEEIAANDRVREAYLGAPEDRE